MQELTCERSERERSLYVENVVDLFEHEVKKEDMHDQRSRHWEIERRVQHEAEQRGDWVERTIEARTWQEGQRGIQRARVTSDIPASQGSGKTEELDVDLASGVEIKPEADARPFRTVECMGELALLAG